MRRRSPIQPLTEPSLVPLADMLTNTVGIMLFILIFTVLATSTAAVGRYLPHEHPSTKDPLLIVCAHGRIYPVDYYDLAHDAYLGPPSKKLSLSDLLSAGQRKISNPWFDMEAKLFHQDPPRFLAGSQMEIPAVIVFGTPSPTGGESMDAVAHENGEFAALLDHTDAHSRMIFFLVYGDSIDVFEAARKLAVAKAFEYGWSPQGPEQRVGTSIFGHTAASSAVTGQ